MPDQEIEFFTTPPASKSYGKVLLRNSDMTIFENTDRYVILFPQMSNIHQVHMSLDRKLREILLILQGNL